ncbi:TonB-dependent receptor [Sphingomonas sp. MMS24-J13]|uniref:TonB-dependent receptor n=1 Tax=Sphingomonas sp. MMS24-J13 TaxID=3238686 RepID=UPI00384EF653
MTAEPVAPIEPSDVGEIIVTGEKSNRTVQNTPASVAVTTSETITEQNLLSAYDVLERTPNLAVNGSRTTFSIRGIGAFNVSGSGDGVLASVYLDGAVLPRTALSAGPLDLYDISQIEVFRGPQSTVQGRNALAGAVVIRTADPSYDWTGRVRLLMTDKDGQRRAGVAIGGPIVDGQVAFRLAGEIARSDGLVYNATRHEDADRRAAETLRAKLLLTPDALPGLRIVATYMHDRHRRGTNWTQFDGGYTLGDRVTTEDAPDVLTVKSNIGTLDVSYDLGRGLTLSSVTNYSDIGSLNTYDQDRNATPGQEGRIVDPSKTFQQELRLNVKRSWVQGLIGAYYLRDDNRDYFFQARQLLGLRRLGVDQVLLGMGLPQSAVDAVLNLYGGAVPISNNLAQPRLTTNYAGFADLTFPLTSRLRLTAGLRYDHESQNRGATQSVVIAAPLPNPAIVPTALGPIVTQLNALLEATAAAATTAQAVRTVTYQAWLPKAGVTYDVARDVSLSLTAQRGYRAGGSGLNQQRGAYYEYNPEYTWNYELALRSQWLDRKLTMNANVYYIDWRDQQVSVQLTPGSAFDTQVINAGKSRLYGAELELSGRPTRRLNLFMGAGYSNTRFENPSSSAGALFQFVPGNEFASAPHWTLSGGATWQHPTGFFANLNANYRSAFYQDIVDQSYRDIHGRTLVNAKIGWQGKNFGAFVVASNIFNVTKATQSFVDLDGRTRGVVTEPRILGLSFEGKF